MYNLLKDIHNKRPLIYNVTNTVTINDCANVQVSLGARPIMSSESLEAKDLIKASKAVNLNIGTINKKIFKLIKKAGALSNKYKKPIILDIVGYGSSSFRNLVMKKLIKKVQFTVIKGNASEIKALVKNTINNENLKLKNSTGIDVNPTDEIQNIKDIRKPEVQSLLKKTKAVCKKLSTVIVITGAVDFVISNKNIEIIENGNPLMSKVCGTGCMLNSVIATFIGASKILSIKDVESAAIAATSIFGICGELAAKSLNNSDGIISYKNKLIDCLYTIKKEDIELLSKHKKL